MAGLMGGPDVFDERLPGLASALDVAAMGPRLAPLTASGEPVRVVGVELLKHKPARRCSLAYTLESRQRRFRVFAKVFANGRGASVFDKLMRISAGVAGSTLRAPQPLIYLDDLRLLLTSWIEGGELAAGLYSGSGSDAVTRMARAAAGLHGMNVDLPEEWTDDDELNNTERWLRPLLAEKGETSRIASRQLRALAGALAELPARRNPIHRDFYPEQLLDADGATALIDFDDSRMGDPAIDLGNFLAHLVLRALQFPACAGRCRSARSAFLDAYVAHAAVAEPVALSRRAQLHEALSLLRLAGVYAQRERWAASLPPLLVRRSVATTGKESWNP